MVLDTISDGEFVFKDTHGDNEQIKIAVDAEEAPDEFFFVHIRMKNEDPAGQPPTESNISYGETNSKRIKLEH